MAHDITLPPVGELADFRQSFETTARGGVGLGVYVQDQTTDSLDIPFLAEKTQLTLAADTVRGDRFLTLEVGEGASVTASIVDGDGKGDIVELANSTIFMQARVIGVVGDVIELDDPVNHVYLSGSTVFISTDNLIVDGSGIGNEKIFTVLPLPTQAGDLTRVILRMEANVVQDSGTLGPLAALRVGVLIRRKKGNGDYKNLINFKTNGDFLAKCFDHTFLPNNGNGIRLFVARLTWTKMGVAQRIDGALNEELQVVIQDNLVDGSFLKFTLALQGHELQENL